MVGRVFTAPTKYLYGRQCNMIICLTLISIHISVLIDSQVMLFIVSEFVMNAERIF